MLLQALAQAGRDPDIGRRAEDVVRDPLLAIACVLLVVVSIGWMIVSRLIIRNWAEAAAAKRDRPKVGKVRPTRDIWRAPP